MVPNNSFVLYQDPLITMHLSEHPAAKGHIEVRPLREVTFLADLSKDEVQHLFFGASYAATALFELIGAQGTNIMLTESSDPLCLHVVARMENDGLNVLWQPKQLDPVAAKDAAKSIRDKMDYLIWARDNPDEAKKAGASKTVSSTPTNTITEEVDAETGEIKKNYLLRSLRRIP